MRVWNGAGISRRMPHAPERLGIASPDQRGARSRKRCSQAALLPFPLRCAVSLIESYG
jgi:hypothetical protein